MGLDANVMKAWKPFLLCEDQEFVMMSLQAIKVVENSSNEEYRRIERNDIRAIEFGGNVHKYIKGQ